MITSSNMPISRRFERMQFPSSKDHQKRDRTLQERLMYHPGMSPFLLHNLPITSIKPLRSVFGELPGGMVSR